MTESASTGYWEGFAREAARLDAPLYVRLSGIVRESPALRALAAGAPRGQPQANVLFAAIHHLLLTGTEHSLARFYPSVAGWDAPAPEGDLAAELHGFVAQHGDRLGALIARGVTNTNEVARSVHLFAGLGVLARRAGGPLHVIELGPSAGLNLYWDAYGYRFHAPDGRVHAAGRADAPLVIDVALRGAGVPPPGPPPAVATRLGLERNPVDLADPFQRAWLKALIWPEHRARHERLDRALAMLGGTRPPIRAGDALRTLPQVLAGLPAGGTIAVVHTLVTYQFSDAARAVLDDILLGFSARRPVHRLSLEYEAERYPLMLTRYDAGAAEATLLGFGDPHGRWLEWYEA